MANVLTNNLFRIAVTTLNFLSPSIVADILLHPFDFATVLLQIGYDPEGIKLESTALVSVILQYALFTIYIPYLLTSMQGLQFMGMPHPSIFYYVNYIYIKEGFRGCYRGLMPKICERLIMVTVNDRVKRSINKDPVEASSEDESDMFLQSLMNGVCSQFFAVLASHPFHVLMVSSFSEFTCNRKSSFLELSHSIYSDNGYFGFFTGLTARLLGELLSLVFSLGYTTIINKQLKLQQPTAEIPSAAASQKTAANLVNYVTDMSRFTVFKPKPADTVEGMMGQNQEVEPEPQETRRSELCSVLHSILGNFTQNNPSTVDQRRNRWNCPLLAYIPFTSKLFYYIMIRDFLSKKISNPFFLVCHCAIVLDTGWDKFPLLSYLVPLVDFVQVYVKPQRRNRLPENKDAGRRWFCSS